MANQAPPPTRPWFRFARPNPPPTPAAPAAPPTRTPVIRNVYLPSFRPPPTTTTSASQPPPLPPVQPPPVPQTTLPPSSNTNTTNARSPSTPPLQPTRLSSSQLAAKDAKSSPPPPAATQPTSTSEKQSTPITTTPVPRRSPPPLVSNSPPPASVPASTTAPSPKPTANTSSPVMRMASRSPPPAASRMASRSPPPAASPTDTDANRYNTTTPPPSSKPNLVSPPSPLVLPERMLIDERTSSSTTHLKPKAFKTTYSDSEDHHGVGTRIITIAGENKGALMEVGYSPNNNKYRSSTSGNNPRPNTYYFDEAGNGIIADHSQKPSNAAAGRGRRQQSPWSGGGAYMNSNVQGVNNSIMFNTNYTHHDPGLHFCFSRKRGGRTN